MKTRTMRVATPLVALATLIATLGIAPPAEASTSLPTLFGMASGDDQRTIDALESATGRGPAIWQIFHDLSNRPEFSSSYAARLADRGAVVYIEVTTQDLSALTSGRQDDRVRVLVDGVKQHLRADSSRRVIIAPLPEANLADHPWGGDPSAYRPGYRRIHDAFRGAGLGPDRVRFTFAMNGWSSSGLNYRQFFPGDDRVDLIGFARMNRGNPWYDYEQSFGRFIREMETTVPSSAPILVTQTGSVTNGGNRDVWLRDMFSRLQSHPRVIGAIYFNRDHPDADFRVVRGSTVDPRVRTELPRWSHPSDAAFIFDGRLDRWAASRSGPTMPAGAVPLSGDWNGDGRDGPGWFHNSTFTLLDRANSTPRRVSFGRAGDVPLVGDWNGNGRDGIGIVRNGRWHLRHTATGGTANLSFTFGRVSDGDIPLVGDWNGNGRDGIGIVRNGRWHLRQTASGGAGQIVFTYGRVTQGDIPLVGDWNGNGRDGIAIVRDGRWHQRQTASGGASQNTFTYGRVTQGDIPIVGDWNRNGQSTSAIVRSSTWHVRDRSGGGTADHVWAF